jgi:probable addiction module antidote protein
MFYAEEAMIKVKDLPKFDPAKYLDTPEAQAEFMSMVLADGDADEIRNALNVVARARGMPNVPRKHHSKARG